MIELKKYRYRWFKKTYSH